MHQKAMVVVEKRGEPGPDAIWLPDSLIDKWGTIIGPHGIAVCAAMARLNGGETECIISPNSLADATGCSTRCVQRVLDQMRDLGLVHCHPTIDPATLKPSRAIRNVCGLCGEAFPILHKHRILPGAKGGEYTLDNIARLCPNCHTLVHSRTYTLNWLIEG